MTDEEIISIMYDHATAFSSCIQFSEEALLNFARELLSKSGPQQDALVQQPECGYTEAMQQFVERADNYRAE